MNEATGRLRVRRSTLVVIPCSGGKLQGSAYKGRGATILKDLSPLTAQRLVERRRQLRNAAHIDETTLMPAFERYSPGHMYRFAEPHLRRAVEQRNHVLILSGGYGLLRADEPIGNYNANFHVSEWWPLVSDCLVEYCQKYSIDSVIGLTAATGGYSQILRRTEWRNAKIRQAILVTPALRGEKGAMMKVPQTLGEAFGELYEDGLGLAWTSSRGIGVSFTPLT